MPILDGQKTQDAGKPGITFAERFRDAEVAQVVDMMALLEAAHLGASGAAIAASPGGSTAIFQVPPKSTCILISVLGGAGALVAGASYTLAMYRMVGGSEVGIAAYPTTATFPALPAVSTNVLFVDGSVAGRSMLLYNPSNTKQDGVHVNLTQLAGTAGGAPQIAVRHITVPGNPFNVDPALWVV